MFEEFKTLIEERLALTVRRHPSISGIPNGAACYRRIISFETGGLYTPESALEMATHFVAQFRSQLMAIEQVQTEALRGTKPLGDATKTFGVPRNDEELTALHTQALERARRVFGVHLKTIDSRPIRVQVMPQIHQSLPRPSSTAKPTWR